MTLKINHYHDTSDRQMCRPKQVMGEDRMKLLHGTPACGKEGATSVDESRIGCPDCLARKVGAK